MKTTSRVHVWPDRYVSSAGQSLPVLSLHEALLEEWDTDVHLCPATLGPDTFPRLVGKPPEDIRYTALFLDIDGPGHKADMDFWAKHFDAIHEHPYLGNAFLYATAGGMRAVYELPRELTLSEFQVVYDRLITKYQQELGIKVDKFSDWNRCYRAPKVIRDGVPQALPYHDPEPGDYTLNLSYLGPLDQSDILARLAKAPKPSPLKTEGLQGAAEEIGRNTTLHKAASSLRNLAWIKEEGLFEQLVLGVNSEFDEPLPEDEARLVAKKVWARYAPPEERTAEAPIEAAPGVDLAEPPERREIVLHAGHFGVSFREAMEALATLPNLYQRNNELVRVQDGNIRKVSKGLLRVLLADTCDFIKLHGPEGEPRKTNPPIDMLDSIYSAGEYLVPELRGILRYPCLRRDGSLLYTPGFDSNTGLYLVDSDLLAGMESLEQESPSRDSAIEALERVGELFAEFPFGNDTHLSVSLAAMITSVVRPLIDGPAPLFLFDSNTPGTGKTIQADMVSLLVEGKLAPRMVLTREEEFEKRVTAILSMGPASVLVDNIAPGKPLGGDSLDALLTSDTWMGRTLGRSDMIVLPNLAIWMATGNNLRVKGDLSRRALRSYLDPRMERPEERTFTIKDLRAHVLQHRKTIISDILRVVRARVLCAPDYQTPKPYGSFESWGWWVRDTLTWLGMPDPVGSQQELRDSDHLTIWGQFIECIRALWPMEASFSIRDLTDACSGVRRFGGNSEAYQGLANCMSELTKDPSSLTEVSGVIRTWSNRVVGGLRLEPAGSRGIRGQLYRVVSVLRGVTRIDDARHKDNDNDDDQVRTAS